MLNFLKKTIKGYITFILILLGIVVFNAIVCGLFIAVTDITLNDFVAFIYIIFEVLKKKYLLYSS